MDTRTSAGKNRILYGLISLFNFRVDAQEIVGIARETIPGIKTFSLPQGLQVEKGPDAVVEYIKENLPGLLEE